MKTITELKFDRVIKDGFHEILKPLGFKKKGNNFYLQREDLGQIINIQKSYLYSKEQIHFTINTGLFIPEYWLAFYNYNNKELPKFPTEPECLIRKRIGELRNQHDTWYDIKHNTDEVKLILEMQENIHKYILPYFEKISSKKSFLKLIENEKLILAPLGKLIVYGELKQFEDAKKEYKIILKEKTNPHFLETVKKYAQKYGLE